MYAYKGETKYVCLQYGTWSRGVGKCINKLGEVVVYVVVIHCCVPISQKVYVPGSRLLCVAAVLLFAALGVRT